MSQAIEISVQTNSNGDLIEPLVLGRTTIFCCGHYSLDIDGVKQSVWITPKPKTEAHARAEVKDLQNQLEESEDTCEQLQRQLRALIESNEQLKVVNDDKEKAYSKLQEVCAKSKKRLRTEHRLQLIDVLEMTVKILQTE